MPLAHSAQYKGAAILAVIMHTKPVGKYPGYKWAQ